MRVYSLITGQFQPLVAQLPQGGEVRCSPDGACLIAFVGKRTGPESKVVVMDEDNNTQIPDEDVTISDEQSSSDNKQPDSGMQPLPGMDENDIGYMSAHVYFVKNLSVVSKVVQFPGIEGNVQSIKLSALGGRQIHLLYINGSQFFSSKILKISVEKNVRNNSAFLLVFATSIVYINFAFTII